MRETQLVTGIIRAVTGIIDGSPAYRIIASRIMTAGMITQRQHRTQPLSCHTIIQQNGIAALLRRARPRRQDRIIQVKPLRQLRQQRAIGVATDKATGAEELPVGIRTHAIRGQHIQVRRGRNAMGGITQHSGIGNRRIRYIQHARYQIKYTAVGIGGARVGDKRRLPTLLCRPHIKAGETPGIHRQAIMVGNRPNNR